MKNLYRELVDEVGLGLNRDPFLDWKQSGGYNWRGKFPYVEKEADTKIAITIRVTLGRNQPEYKKN